MKKSINITLNGLVFSLEEDAYEMLKKYLDSIKEYYEGLEETEILADIESSIAEKFTAKLKSSKQAVTLVDVEETIKVMGTVEEITETEEDGKEDKAVNEELPIFKKRLYRNTDDVIIAGVASGIAAYFGIDPVFVRIIFVALVFANGFGILAYLIFWIAMPKAETNAQKLEMRGKPVNLAEIEQVVKEKSKAISKEGGEVIGRLQQNGTFRKILNFPIRIIEGAFVFLKKTARFLLPAASVFFGVCILIGSVFAIIGLSIVSALMIFNIGSPYLISDLPLAEIATMPFYYVGVISLYALCAIPAIFLSVLGITMIRRKNSFSLVVSSILVGIWMVTIVVFVVAAVDLAPMIKTRVSEIDQQKTIIKNFDYKDFSKLYLSGNQKIRVVKGNDFFIKLSGREEDLSRLLFNIEEGQLQITQKDRDKKGFCIFCFNREITGEITVPKLDSFVGIGRTQTVLEGFDKDLYISLGEMARAEIELENQNLSGSLSGVGSSLELSGPVGIVDIKMDGSADLMARELVAKKIKLAMSVFSSARLVGEADELEINIEGNSQLIADDLAAKNIKIEASDFSSADIWAEEKLNVTSSGSAFITYKGEPGSVVKNSTGRSSISNQPKSDEYLNKIYIKTDVKQYSPVMSSIRGIGLTPEFYGETDGDIVFRFSTNQGYLVANWNNPNYVQEIDVSDLGEKIYWTYLPGEVRLNTSQPIYINLEARPEDEDRIITSTRIEFIADDQGMVTQKVNN